MTGGSVTEKITPETYEKMNKEFEEEGLAFRIIVPTQEKIDEWQKGTELNIVNNLVEKIAELLDAEVQHSLLVDHKGTEKRKISITYKEDDSSNL